MSSHCFLIHGTGIGKCDRGSKACDIENPLTKVSSLEYRATTCKVQEVPVKCLQLIFNPNIGSSRIDVDKLGSSAMEDEEDGLYCYGKKRLLGAFCLIYIVEGYVQIYLDEKHAHDYGNVSPQLLECGQTLLVERDEEASPSIMVVRPCDSKGIVGIQGIGKFAAGFENRIHAD